MSIAKSIPILLLILLCSCDEQIKEMIFEDEFADNHNEWLLESNEMAELKIADGQYVIEHKRKEGSYAAWQTGHTIDWSRDFCISVSTTWISGEDNHGYGIYFGGKGFDGYNGFEISSNRHVRVYSIEQDDEFKDLMPWKSASQINGTGKPDELMLCHEDKLMKIYVNGESLGSFDPPVMHGQSYGFIVRSNQTVAFDSFRMYYFVKQDQWHAAWEWFKNN